MPRTKISKKNSKRNREDANSIREQKLCEFSKCLDDCVSSLEVVSSGYIAEVNNKLRILMDRTNSSVLHMAMKDFAELDLGAFDWTASAIMQQERSHFYSNNNDRTNSSILGSMSTLLHSNSSSVSASAVNRGKASNPNDEGYLTEDSASVCSNSMAMSLAIIPGPRSQSAQAKQQRIRTPGPLNSARARRSRSASEKDYSTGLTLKPLPSARHAKGTDAHASRSKFRTPVAKPRHAFSADRLTTDHGHISAAAATTEPYSPPTAFMRWPKPGELVLSTDGSPMVAQIMPGKFANVNIPMRNGVFSMQPKKLDQLSSDIIDGIDATTLHQIKTLHANLNLIVSLADKATQK